MHPLSAPWGWVAAARVAAYRRGLLRTRRLGRPVISVGALEMGGSGKTPAVAAITRLLTSRGRRVAILSRGYGRTDSTPRVVSTGNGPRCTVDRAGDEPAWYAYTLPGVQVAVASRREEAAELLASEGADVFVLDDGFQHVRVARAVDLLVVDAERPFYRASPPPAGRLREAPGAARRASAFLVQGSGDATEEVRTELEKRFPRHDSFTFDRVYPGAKRLDGFLQRTSQAPTVPDARLLAFAGIARPERFFASLTEVAEVVVSRSFDDHHWYTAQQLAELESAARHAGAEALITTEKDAARLVGLQLPQIPIWVWGYRLQPRDPRALGDCLERGLGGTR